MKLFRRGSKERFAPEHETELLISWGWTPVEEEFNPVSRKATVIATPAVVSDTKEEATEDLIIGEEDDSDSWK